MELYRELLIQILGEEDVRITCVDLNELLESRCYQALKEIKAVLQDDGLDDAACFAKIEAIVCIFEEMGSNGGFRHDFG